MNFHRVAVFCAVVLAAALAVPSGLPQQPEGKRDVTVEDYFAQADITAIAHSQTGRYVAYAESRWQQSTDDRKADLWVVEYEPKKEPKVRKQQPRRLTSDRAGERSLQWVYTDPISIYALANRKREGEKRPPYDGKTQVWRIGLKEGDLQAVTQVEGGVEDYQVSPNGTNLYYQVSVEQIDDDWKDLRRQFKQIDYGHGVTKFSQVWKLNLQNWRTEKVIDARRVIREMALSPDGKYLAMITTPDEKVISFEGQSRVDVCELATGKISTLPDKAFRADAPSPYGWLEHLAWGKHEGQLAFNVVFDGYPAEVMRASVKFPDATVVKLPRPEGYHIRGYGSPLAFRNRGPQDNPRETLGVLLEKAGRVTLAEFGAEGRPVLNDADEVVDAFSFSHYGEHGIVLKSSPTTFPDIYTLEGKRLTNVNPQAETWKLPKVSIFSWKGANGVPCEGILELPHDFKEGQRVPLILEIHGGPTTSSTYRQMFWIYGRGLWPSKGYAVLAPNYRGSTGYGDKFTTDLVGHENDLDVRDILAGVDALVAKGVADPERLAVTGWSNGGYLTNCILTQTTRFKAAISGASIIDAAMEFGGNDEPAYTMVMKKGFPWNATDRSLKSSPMYALDKIKTPTLIHVGARDERCPPSHSATLYRALKEYNRVPTELLVYPGEPHGLTKYSNRKAKMEWDLAWLNRYVRGK